MAGIVVALTAASQPTLDELGVKLRPTRESLEDTFRWLAAAGHLPAKNAGRLAGEGNLE